MMIILIIIVLIHRLKILMWDILSEEFFKVSHEIKKESQNTILHFYLINRVIEFPSDVMEYYHE